MDTSERWARNKSGYAASSSMSVVVAVVGGGVGVDEAVNEGYDCCEGEEVQWCH